MVELVGESWLSYAKQHLDAASAVQWIDPGAELLKSIGSPALEAMADIEAIFNDDKYYPVPFTGDPSRN